MNNLEKIYQERVNRLMTTLSHKEPDIMPVMHNGETWNISYSGFKIADVVGDPKQLRKHAKHLFPS